MGHHMGKPWQIMGNATENQGKPWEIAGHFFINGGSVCWKTHRTMSTGGEVVIPGEGCEFHHRWTLARILLIFEGFNGDILDDQYIGSIC